MNNTASRKTLTIKNTAFSFINYFIKLIMAFAVKTIFIQIFSIEYLGVNTLFTNVLTILSLADLGIASAIIFLLFKPVADDDNQKINSILNAYRKLYFYVGLTILIVGLAISPFVGFFVSEPTALPINLTVIFIMFLLNSVCTYFLGYRFILFIAYQRKDIEYKISSVTITLSTLAQLLILILFKNYYLYLATSILTNILSSVLIFFVSLKTFPNIKAKNAKPLDLQTKTLLKTNIKGIFYHKISYIVMVSASSLIISKFIGINVLGVYSNYLLITTQITAIFLLICDSVRGSVGNMLASSDINNSYKNYKILRFVFYWLSGFCSICLFVLFTPFIDLWSVLGRWDIIEGGYTFDIIVTFVIAVNFYIYSSRCVISVFRESIGNFQKDRFKGLIEAGINICVSLILVNFLGIAGVLLGSVVGAVFTSLWVDPYMVYKYYFKKSVLPHLFSVLLNFAITLIIGAITWFVCSFIVGNGILIFLIKICICAVLPNLLFALFYFSRQDFKDTLIVFKEILKGKNIK